MRELILSISKFKTTKRSMKRTLMILLIMTLTRICAFSSTTSPPIEKDSIVSVTASDIKYANLIFVEHKKLLKENYLLGEQLHNVLQINSNLVQVDSLRLQQIGEYNQLNQSYLQDIDKLNKEIRKKNRAMVGWKIGGITVSVGLILFLLLK